jgi:hypothetical protein
MKVVAYTPLHYGKEYLWYAVHSVRQFVDLHYVLYTPTPSYGHTSNLVCPDTEAELKACIDQYDHVIWHRGQWNNETEHRGTILELVEEDVELILPVDADEVWGQRELGHVLESVYAAEAARDWRVCGFQHLWRSFYWRCEDAMAPVRVIDLRVPRGTQYVTGKVFHFGYAQSVETMRYKWSIHGHQNELRVGWLRDKFERWVPGIDDVHPTCSGIWNPSFVSPADMPKFMRNHPYYLLERIS